MTPQKTATAEPAIKLVQAEAPNVEPLFLTPAEVKDLLRLPSEDQARRFIAKLPDTVRVPNVGRRVLVFKGKLLAHLGL